MIILIMFQVQLIMTDANDYDKDEYLMPYDKDEYVMPYDKKNM